MAVSNVIHRLTHHLWYGQKKANPFLVPIEQVYRHSVGLMKEAYQSGRIVSKELPVPVIVVGNLTVGGTGKTPLTIWLAQFLKSKGFKPGIISRGYGGHITREPLGITFQTSAYQGGDEPVIIARRTGCPVFVHPQRVLAGEALLKAHDVDILITDDGLQHYELIRDIEIAVIDGQRGFGNGHLLPAGPLREPIERLKDVDMIVHHGLNPEADYSMELKGALATNLKNVCQRKPLPGFIGAPLHAMAGIGNPDRFYGLLEAQGLTIQTKTYPDHYRYTKKDLDFAGDDALLMTEKDAVKCFHLARENHWYLPVDAHLSPRFGPDLLALIDRASKKR
jgi:tetraacyldisaccharide 4'-kinase